MMKKNAWHICDCWYFRFKEIHLKQQLRTRKEIIVVKQQQYICIHDGDSCERSGLQIATTKNNQKKA